MPNPPSHPFRDARTEQARTIIARGLAQRLAADVILKRLATEGLLSFTPDYSYDLDSWR
jgi:hypothetical protein